MWMKAMRSILLVEMLVISVSNAAIADESKTTLAEFSLAEFNDVWNELITTDTCADVRDIVFSAKKEENISTEDLIRIAGVTIYLMGFAKGRGVDVKEVNYAFGLYCVSDMEQLFVDFE